MLSSFSCNLIEFPVFVFHLHSFIKKVVPGRQYQIEPADNDAWITVQFRLDSIDLAMMLVLGLGEHAIVVEPQELHEAVLNTAAAILSKHNKHGG